MQLEQIDLLRNAFGEKLQENVRLSNYTTSHVGGLIPALVSTHTIEDLVFTVTKLWELSVPLIVLGSGSNILVSDKGLNAIVIHNRAHNLFIDSKSDTPSIQAESGAILGTVARQSALRGLSGMEWSAPIPGTVGGAVYGNIGAYGSTVKSCLKMAKILHKTEGITDWSVERFDFKYRSSILKRENVPAVILSATFNAIHSSREEAWEKINAHQAHRKETQPPGATMGSTFKNPKGDHAARLIEAAGLKGRRIGGAMISPLHANFIINLDNATAQEIWQLINLMRNTVYEQFGVKLVTEIEILGEFVDD